MKKTVKTNVVTEDVVTVELVKEEFKRGFDKSSLIKFNKFLEERNETELYYKAVAKRYNESKSILTNVGCLHIAVNCAYRDDSELGSCFVEFDKSKEGRAFWIAFNKDWQTYRQLKSVK